MKKIKIWEIEIFFKKKKKHGEIVDQNLKTNIWIYINNKLIPV